MLPVVCIVGASGSGKTTFLEKLIGELRRRNYRVGTIKHDVHGFEMDREGKDTWRHRRAGANTVAICSKNQVACIRSTEEEMSLGELAERFFWKEDVLLAEGFKRSRFPKIEVFRSAVAASPVCTPRDNLIGIITDDEVDLDVSRFRFEEVQKVADFIENTCLQGKKRHRILVQIDGKAVPMEGYAEDIVAAAILGMLSTLSGAKRPGQVDIHIRSEDV
jgi:molybdopterin-guanine dinucleotide biosynthesis protein B